MKRLLDEAQPESALLREAERLEPPAGTGQRILARIEEEALARSGLREPRRLQETDEELSPLLARASLLEPPLGQKARTRLRLPSAERPALPRWPLALLGTASLTALMLLVRASPAPAPASEAGVDALASLTLGAPRSVTIESATGVGADGAFGLGDTLSLSSPGTTRFTLRGVGELVLGGHEAQLKLVENGQNGVRLALLSGAVAIHAEKRPPQAPLLVETSDAQVRVVGTIFAVAKNDAGTSVAVAEGRVLVSRVLVSRVLVNRGARTETLAAGEEWSAAAAAVVRCESPAWAAPLWKELLPPAREPSAASDTVSSTTAAPPVPGSSSMPVAAPAAPSPQRAAQHRMNAARPTQPPAPPAEMSAAKLIDLLRAATRDGDHERAAGLLRTLSYAPDALESDRVAARLQLAGLLDRELARPREALLAWRDINRTSEAQRPRALFQQLLFDVELSLGPEARAALAQCLEHCTIEQRGIARYLAALAQRGGPDYAPAFLEARRQAPDALNATVLTLASRARELAPGQPSRAGILARLVLQLDPSHAAADMRALARP